MRHILIFAFLLVPAAAQPNDTWQKLEFLLGEWTGTAGAKDTKIGAGEGAFSFAPELGGKIIVRHNSSKYDSGVHHDDLMVIYRDSPAAAPEAIYFDSEGHVIRYRATAPAANRAVFESDGSQPGPKYRLTYWMEGTALNGRFEIAPPGSDYKTYMSWTSARKH